MIEGNTGAVKAASLTRWTLSSSSLKFTSIPAVNSAKTARLMEKLVSRQKLLFYRLKVFGCRKSIYRLATALVLLWLANYLDGFHQRLVALSHVTTICTSIGSIFSTWKESWVVIGWLGAGRPTDTSLWSAWSCQPLSSSHADYGQLSQLSRIYLTLMLPWNLRSIWCLSLPI